MVHLKDHSKYILSGKTSYTEFNADTWNELFPKFTVVSDRCRCENVGLLSIRWQTSLSIWFHVLQLFFPQRHCSVIDHNHFKTIRYFTFWSWTEECVAETTDTFLGLDWSLKNYLNTRFWKEKKFPTDWTATPTVLKRVMPFPDTEGIKEERMIAALLAYSRQPKATVRLLHLSAFRW